MFLQAFFQPLRGLGGERLRLGQIHEAAEIGRVLNDLVHVHVVGRAGAQHDAIGNIPGTQRFAAQSAVDDGLGSSQLEEDPGHLTQLRGNRGPCQLHIAVAAGTEDNHLTQGRGDARGHKDLFCHIPQPDHILGCGDEGACRNKNAGFFRAGDHVGALTVPADGGQSQYLLPSRMAQQPVEHGGLAGVFAHTDYGHTLHLPELADQFCCRHILSPSGEITV